MAGNLYLTNTEIRFILQLLDREERKVTALGLGEVTSNLIIKLRKTLVRRRGS